jgi:BASS family bile acid:Na+ symporter
MFKLFQNWTLPIAMLFGIAAYRYISGLAFLLPYFIFAMLFLSFSKISFRELKISPLHARLLSLQAVAALASYALFSLLDKVVAESVLVCFIAPTATSAAVVTQKLGGDAASVTAYTMLSNLFAALVIPVFFPLIEPSGHLPFAAASVLILQKLFLLLVLPFICAQILRFFLPRLHGVAVKYSWFSFYIWAFSLTLATAVTCGALLNAKTTLFTGLSIAFVALAACALQFMAGKFLGSRYDERVSGGQAIGQKNTILAIWVSGTYLNPLSAIGPGSYVLWQNIINSYQLWKKRKERG